MILDVIASNAVAIFILMSVLWIVSVKLQNASIVDPFWSIGFLLVAVNSARLVDALSPPQVVLLALVSSWAIRLWLHLFVRAWGTPEDHRYQAFRSQFGADRYWWVSFFQVFMLQGALMLLISVPLQVALTSVQPKLNYLHFLGAFMVIFGTAFEAIADWQLNRFRADENNKGQVLDTGLWRYSRHPNYFGEAVLWWGFWLFAVPSENGWMTVYAPILMTLLLLKVSGVALLEKTLAQTKPKYHEYIRKTSPFVPMRPKEDRHT